MKTKYDVIIAGGGTSGVSCAYNCGKLGLKTLLVERNSYLGGSMTSSLVTPAMKTSENAINTDFFNEIYKKLHELGGAITYIDGNKGWFNPELTKIVLDKMMDDANVDVVFEAEIEKADENLSGYSVAICENNNYISPNELLPYCETRFLVDATGDAKICEILNYKFLENKNKTQPLSLRFTMSGIDTKKFFEWIMEYDKNREVTTSCTIEGNIYGSTAYTWDSNTDWALKPLFKEAIANNIITEADSNYFQLFSIPGMPDSITFNAPRIINSDISRTMAYKLGRESILRLSGFCRKYLPGFENSYISSIANSLGVRISNCVEGKYVYKKDDLISGKKFENPAVIANYPIDVHSDKRDSSKLEKVNQEYQLPIEALIVDKNLFAIGRCLSAEFEAQAALRIIPSCFSMGESVAKYIAKLI